MSESILKSLQFIVVFIFLLLFAAVQLGFEVYTRAQITAINEAKSLTVDLKNLNTVDASLNDKSVYAQGQITTTEELVDSRYGIRTKNLALITSVEYYQWDKRSRKGKTRYDLGWHNSPINSADFADDKKNTVITHIDATRQFTSNARLGAYKVDPHLLDNLPQKNLGVQFSQADLDKMHEAILAQAQGSSTQADSIKEYYDDLANNRTPQKLVNVVGNYLFYGEDINDPDIGDVRVQFLVIPMQEVSLIGNVANGTLRPFKDSHGKVVELIGAGKISKQVLLSSGEESSKIFLWLIRIVMVIFIAVSLRYIGEQITRVCSGVPGINVLLAVSPWLFAVVMAPIVSLLIAGIGFII